LPEIGSIKKIEDFRLNIEYLRNSFNYKKNYLKNDGAKRHP